MDPIYVLMGIAGCVVMICFVAVLIETLLFTCQPAPEWWIIEVELYEGYLISGYKQDLDEDELPKEHIHVIAREDEFSVHVQASTLADATIRALYLLQNEGLL